MIGQFAKNPGLRPGTLAGVLEFNLFGGGCGV